MPQPIYLHLFPGTQPPPLPDSTPFLAVLVLESEVSSDWQEQTSQWLVRSGCRYMMAWGTDCSQWDDSVDMAILEEFDFGEIPDDRFVMTTWHDKESMNHFFWFAGQVHQFSTSPLDRTILIHVSEHPREAELLAAFNAAQLAVPE